MPLGLHYDTFDDVICLNDISGIHEDKDSSYVQMWSPRQFAVSELVHVSVGLTAFKSTASPRIPTKARRGVEDMSNVATQNKVASLEQQNLGRSRKI